MEEENKYLLTEDELNKLLRADAWYRHLLNAGVDNCLPYEDACHTLFPPEKGHVEFCDEELEYFDHFKETHKYEQ